MRISHYPQTTLQVVSKTTSVLLDTTCLGGYREGETPGPIPNPEAKPLFADNTYPFRIGNVGRCLVKLFFTLLFIPYIILAAIIIIITFTLIYYQ